LTPERFDNELRRLAGNAWDAGFSAGLDWATRAIAGEPLPRTVNPYREQTHEADQAISLDRRL
jgi:hypothetical protein